MALELTEDQARIVVEPFLERYRAALLAHDLEGVALCFGSPGLVVADGAVIPWATSDEAAAAFGHAAEQYTARGMRDVKPVIERLESNSRLLLTADVRWEYYGATGEVLAGELFRYILRIELNGPRIHAVVARTV